MARRAEHVGKQRRLRMSLTPGDVSSRKMAWALRLYTLAWWVLLPFAVCRLFWRARREPLYRTHLGERFGLYGALPGKHALRNGSPPLLWMHVVSLGETRAAEPLLEALRRAHPDLAVLLTHMTATGRDAGRLLLRDGDLQCWLPYDLSGFIRRFLLHYRPTVGVLMETEVWPNLAQGCAQLGVPLLLANARLSARSAARWARWPALARPVFEAITAATAQSEADALRLQELGLHDVSVSGNLKFDRESDPALRERGLNWRSVVDRPVLLLASTREHQGLAEEALLLDALPAHVLQRALLVVVPRHPQRMDAVYALLCDRGLRVVRRSQALPERDTQVWLGDSLGEMPAYYAMAHAAFVGGSLLALGGQNLIEACAEGCPVVMGPHTFNFTEAVEQGIAAGAVVQVRDAAAVWACFGAWLDDASSHKQASKAALRFAARHRGAAAKQADWVGRYLIGSRTGPSSSIRGHRGIDLA